MALLLFYASVLGLVLKPWASPGAGGHHPSAWHFDVEKMPQFLSITTSFVIAACLAAAQKPIGAGFWLDVAVIREGWMDRIPDQR